MRVQHGDDHYHDVVIDDTDEIVELDGRPTPDAGPDGYAYVVRRRDGVLICCLPQGLCDKRRDVR
jgi:hypothetical protein